MGSWVERIWSDPSINNLLGGGGKKEKGEEREAGREGEKWFLVRGKVP